MGGIMVNTPGKVDQHEHLPRVKQTHTADAGGQFSETPIRQYNLPKGTGDKLAVLGPLKLSDIPPKSLKRATTYDFIWIVSFPLL